MIRYDFVSNVRLKFGDRTLIPVMLDEKWGLINECSGQEVCKPMFKYMPEHIGKNLIKCCLLDHSGIIDFEGNTIFPFAHGQIEVVGENRVIANHFIGKVVLTINGTRLSSETYDNITYLKDSRTFKVVKNDIKNDKKLVGLLDYDGANIIPIKYADIYVVGDYARVIDKDGKIGLFDLTNRRLICRPKYFGMGDYYENRAAVKNGKGLWGYIDRNGVQIVPCKYKEVYRFSNGFAAVSLDSEKYAYINADGDEVTKHIYLTVSNVNEDGSADVMCKVDSIKSSNKEERIKGKIYLMQGDNHEQI